MEVQYSPHHAKNNQESHEHSNKHFRIKEPVVLKKNQRTRKKNYLVAPNSLRYQIEAIAEGNEAWSEILAIQGIYKNYTQGSSSNRKQDLEPDNIPLRSK